MADYHITLIITGSVAAVKSFDLIQQLQHKGASISLVLTESAQQWVTPTAVAELDCRDVLAVSHIRQRPNSLPAILAASDLILIAPATANFIQQLAYKDTLLGQKIRHSGKAVMVAPAMNVMMWQHPATQRNCKALLAEDVIFLGPAKGEMACGDRGYGRFMEPEDITQSALAWLDDNAQPASQGIQNALVDDPHLPSLHPNGVSRHIGHILLMIHHSQDAIMAYPLISTLKARGYQLSCAMNEKTKKLLPSEALAAILGNMVHTHHYQSDIQGMEHIRLPEQADMLLIMSAGSVHLDQMIRGNASDFLGCLYLASKKPVVMLPSKDMDQHKQAKPLRVLKQDGVNILNTSHDAHLSNHHYVEQIVDQMERLIKNSDVKETEYAI